MRDAEELAGEPSLSVKHIGAKSEEDVAVVTSEAGAVEELALSRHPLDNIDFLGAEQTVVTLAMAWLLHRRHPHIACLPPQLRLLHTLLAGELGGQLGHLGVSILESCLQLGKARINVLLLLVLFH